MISTVFHYKNCNNYHNTLMFHIGKFAKGKRYKGFLLKLFSIWRKRRFGNFTLQ